MIATDAAETIPTSSPRVQIRRLEPEDADYLLTILKDRWEISFKDAIAAARIYTAGGTASGFLAAAGTHRVGICLLDHNTLDVDTTRHPWLLALWVDPPSRGRGLGQELVHACLREAATQGFTEVFLDTTDAEKYHASYGWERVGTAKYHGKTTVIMRRDITMR